MDTTDSTSRLPWVIAGNGVLRIAGGASTVLVGTYLADLNARGMPMSASLAGALAATSYGAELLSAIPLGLLSDVMPVRALMTAGAVLAAAATLLFRFTHNVSIFFASRMLEGVAAAVGVPPLLAYLADVTTGHASVRARAMSYFELSLLAGLALGGLTAAQLWMRFGLGAFTALAAIYVGAAGLFMTARSTRTTERGRDLWRSVAQGLAVPSVRRLAPVWLCMNTIIGLWLGPTFYFLVTRAPGTTQWLDGLFAGDVNGLGWLLLAYALVFTTGLLVWSHVLPLMALRRALRIALLAMLGVCGGLLLVNHMVAAPPILRWITLVGIAFLIMIESGFTPAALSLLAASIGSQSGRGGIMGVYSFLLGLGALIGSAIAGIVGQRYAIDGLTGATVVCALVALMLSSRLDVPSPLTSSVS